MPELAEVDFFRRRWEAGLGDVIHTAELHATARVFRGCDTAALLASVPGQRLEHSACHGKQILFTLSAGQWLGVHLGMTGDLTIQPADYTAQRHDHLLLRQSRRALVFTDSRMFGRIRHDDSPGQPPAWWRALPPAVLSPDFTIDRLRAVLARRPRTPLKALLLDQAICPGVGNWMADEILWRLRRHPLARSTDLPPTEAVSLHREIQWVAQNALATIGLDWTDPPTTWLYQHRWDTGRPCPRCHTLLLREEAAGRTSCWCPTCQSIPPHLTIPVARLSISKGTGYRRQH
jgi:formamidopyrimidine-DNA glycosylase